VAKPGRPSPFIDNSLPKSLAYIQRAKLEAMAQPLLMVTGASQAYQPGARRAPVRWQRLPPPTGMSWALMRANVMTTTVSVDEEKAMMTIDLVPVHPGLTEGIRALYGEAPCLSTRCPPEGVQGWVQGSIRRREADEEYSYAILRDTGLVGLCSLRGITSLARRAWPI